MWLVVWLTLMNSLGSSSGFINPARVTLGGDMPVGMMDASIAAAFLWAAIRGGNTQLAYPRIRMHPLFSWLIGLWSVTFIGGTVASLGGLSGLREILQGMRDFALMPACIFIGYRALSDPRSVWRMSYLLFWCGVGNALMLLIRFQGASGRVQIGSDNVNPLRQIDYMTSYTTVTCLVCVLSVLTGLRVVSPWLAAGLGSICLLGVCSAVSRTALVCLAFGLCTVLVLLPRGKRLGAVVKGMLLVPVIVGALFAGIEVASQLTRRDFSKVLTKMVDTVLPESQDDGVKKEKAWDTRLPSLKVELELFATSPLFGRGYTAIDEFIKHGGTNFGAFGHNTITSMMARTGLLGLSSYVLMFMTMVVLGLRMYRENVDRASVLFGLIAFFAGSYTFVSSVCTMMFNYRGAMFFAVICGMTVRAREIQETTRELALAEQFHENEEFDTYLQESHNLGAVPNL